MSDGCTCQGCGQKYRVDVLVPDALWDRIRPVEKTGGAGMLCGPCVLKRIESFGEFAAYKLTAT